MFSPGADPPVAHITNMLEGTLWMAAWDGSSEAFRFVQVDDYGPRGQGVPLEMLYNRKGDRLFVTIAKPGFVNVYDNADPQHPKFLKAIPAAGAHHLVLSPDEGYLCVQNSLLNLPGMSDGSVTVIDIMTKGEVIASMDTLKNQGLNPNCIVLLPPSP